MLYFREDWEEGAGYPYKYYQAATSTPKLLQIHTILVSVKILISQFLRHIRAK